jgi:hypothetical protein
LARTVQPVVEEQGSFFDVLEFFPTLTKEVLEENRYWLEPTFIDPVSGRLGPFGIGVVARWRVAVSGRATAS